MQRAAADIVQAGAHRAQLHPAVAGRQARQPSDYKGKWVVLYFYPKDQNSGLHHRSSQLPA